MYPPRLNTHDAILGSAGASGGRPDIADTNRIRTPHADTGTRPVGTIRAYLSVRFGWVGGMFGDLGETRRSKFSNGVDG